MNLRMSEVEDCSKMRSLGLSRRRRHGGSSSVPQQQRRLPAAECNKLPLYQFHQVNCLRCSRQLATSRTRNLRKGRFRSSTYSRFLLLQPLPWRSRFCPALAACTVESQFMRCRLTARGSVTLPVGHSKPGKLGSFTTGGPRPHWLINVAATCPGTL